MDITIKNKRLNGSVAAISSKSYGQRALFLSILAEGNSKIEIENISDDIKMAIDITNKIKSSNDKNKYLELNMGESATCLRLIIPILCVLGQNAKLKRESTLINRTIDIFLNLLPKHGVNIWEEDEYVFVKGQLKNGNYTLPGDISSQFISGLLIALGSLKKTSTINISTKIESLAYIEMTINLMEKFGAKITKSNNTFTCQGPYKACDYKVEGDWSSALFYIVGGVEVKGLRLDSLQADMKALEYLETLGYENISNKGVCLRQVNSYTNERILDASNMPDAIPILSIASALTKGKTKVINIERLRLKESDRVKSTCQMLENLGVEVELDESSFSFNSVSYFKSCTIDSFMDHRIAMAGSIAATFAEGPVKILNAQVVSKSYPNFYKDFLSLGGEYVK